MTNARYKICLNRMHKVHCPLLERVWEVETEDFGLNISSTSGTLTAWFGLLAYSRTRLDALCLVAIDVWLVALHLHPTPSPFTSDVRTRIRTCCAAVCALLAMLRYHRRRGHVRLVGTGRMCLAKIQLVIWRETAG